MNTLDTLTQRNHDFAEHRFVASQSLMPTLRTMIVTCVDPRVDPAYILGIEPGEAVVIRNVGGRITPVTMQEMGMLQMITQVQGMQPGGPLNIVVLHHTDCGITRLHEKTDVLANYFGIAATEVEAKAVSDPHTAVAIDVTTLRANPRIPGNWPIYGLVYDVATGLVETVVAPN